MSGQGAAKFAPIGHIFGRKPKDVARVVVPALPGLYEARRKKLARAVSKTAKDCTDGTDAPCGKVVEKALVVVDNRFWSSSDRLKAMAFAVEEARNLQLVDQFGEQPVGGRIAVDYQRASTLVRWR